MFYSQPLSTRFGTDLIDHITSGTWEKLDIAVAWARASGVTYLEPALKDFLKAGNELSVVVGVDLDNTTKEGLEGLLALKNHGAASIFVHHNETGTIFHPKLYLFRNPTRGKLIVGSNNITEAGLFRNTEAGLELDVNVGDQIIVSAKNAIDAWRDTSLGLAHELDSVFLAELVANEYIKDEATLKARAAANRASSRSKSGGRKKLFGSVHVTRPPALAQLTPSTPTGTQPKKKRTAPTSGSGTTREQANASLTVGQVLLIRVRKARGTQVQIPLAVLREPFFAGVAEVVSVADGITRGIHPTHATRAKSSNPNTLKLEMPETKTMKDPVARFERTPTGIQYEVYDTSSGNGQSIMRKLRAGRTSSPPTTRLTVPSSPASSTWWRFI